MNENARNYFGKTDKYEDIIDLPHHVSDHHPQMPEGDRAAQFAPFAALTGYGSAIKETERLTEKEIELDEEEKIILDRRLEYIKKHLPERPEVTIVYFEPDSKKSGGAYLEICEKIRKIDASRRILILTDGREIKIDHIVEIRADILSDE